MRIWEGVMEEMRRPCRVFRIPAVGVLLRRTAGMTTEMKAPQKKRPEIPALSLVLHFKGNAVIAIIAFGRFQIFYAAFIELAWRLGNLKPFRGFLIRCGFFCGYADCGVMQFLCQCHFLIPSENTFTCGQGYTKRAEKCKLFEELFAFVSQDAGFFTVPVAFLDRLALIVIFLAFGQRDFEFGQALGIEIDFGGNDGVAVALDRAH